MKVEVLGYKVCDFPDDEGKPVKGISLKTAFEPLQAEDDFFGRDIKKVWLSEAMLKANGGFIPDVGSMIELDYDYDGRRSIFTGYRAVEG